MSCSFWNMRRRLKAQQQNNNVVADIATAQVKEKASETNDAEKPIKKKVGVKNDKRAD